MNNKSLKTEYRKLLRISNTQLKAELKKPASEQDAFLIDECLENISFCEKELASLRAEKAAFKGASFGSLRRAGVALLVLVLSFAAFATVSEAAGYRVWTALIKQDAGYLRVDYVPEPTAAPSEAQVSWEDGEYSFFSKYDFDWRIEQDGFEPFAEENDDFRFMNGSIRSTRRDYYAAYSLRGEVTSVYVRMIAKAVEPSPVTVWGMNESIPYYTLEVSGIRVTYQTESSGNLFATWQVRGCIFCASVFDPQGAPDEIFELIVR